MDEYFTSYEDLKVHRLLLKDKPRMEAYKEAIEKNVFLFRNKVVMDVGAGTGILSLMMARAGARLVIAVEASDLAKVVTSVAKDNGYDDVIQVHHTKVEDLTLPADVKVDVIVSEWMGLYLLHELMIDSVIYARDKFLSDDGVIFPSEAKLIAAPCSMASFKADFDYWKDIYGFDLGSIRELEIKSKHLKPEICIIPPQDILADPVCLHHFDIRYTDADDLKCLTSTHFMSITKAGDYDGLCIWFECLFDGRQFDGDGNESGCVISLSTSPWQPETHWKQTLIAFKGLNAAESNTNPMINSNGHINNESNATKLLFNTERNFKKFKPSPDNGQDSSNKNYVEQDEVIGWKLTMVPSEENRRHYNITFEMLDPTTVEHPIPCNCMMPKCVIIAKMIENEFNQNS